MRLINKSIVHRQVLKKVGLTLYSAKDLFRRIIIGQLRRLSLSLAPLAHRDRIKI